MASNQAYLFVIFTIVGIIIGVVFDLFRILRKTIKTNEIFTNIEDILFWIITGILIIYSMYIFCDGELRFFMIIGIIIGTIMYMITFSKYVIKISIYIINILKKILKLPILLFMKIVKRLILKPVTIVCINIRKKFVKKYKKYRGKFLKKEKYNNI